MKVDDKETIAISKFKATCLEVLKRVQRTRRPVVVTRFGEPVAEVVPPSPPAAQSRPLGAMRDRGRIVADITAPVVPPHSWDAVGQ